MDFHYPIEDVNFQLWVQQLVQRKAEISTMPEGPDRDTAQQGFASYVLTGINRTDVDDITQISVDVMQQALDSPAIPILRRDYDSLLIFSNTIPIETPVYVYPIPRRQDTLLESLHAKITMITEPGGQACTLSLSR